VSNGLFTVTLDFGSGVFDGNARWLEIAVRTNGASDFVTLAPRQPLTPTPYAMLAGTASGFSGTLPVSQLSGVVPLAQLPGAVMTNNATGVTLSGNLFGNFGGSFYGNGGGLTNLAANNISGNYAVSFIPPPLMPGVGSVTTGGSVDDGTHYYRITYVTTAGETEFGPQMWPGAVCAGGSNTVNLTNISVSTSAGVTARNIYRGSQPYPYFRYLATISNNTATTYTDIAAESSLPPVGWQNRDDTFEGQFRRGTNLVGWASVASTAWGYNALGNAIGGLGFDNSAFGVGALASANGVVNEVAVGNFALNAKTLGGADVAIGVHSGQFLTNGGSNTLVGEASAESLQAGNNNTVVGSAGLWLATFANYNSTLGWGALYSAQGDHNLALGYKAGYYETGGDSFYVSTRPGTNLASGRAAALMYGTFNDTPASQTLTINAQTTIANIAPGCLPFMHPTAGYLNSSPVVSDGATWLHIQVPTQVYGDIGAASTNVLFGMTDLGAGTDQKTLEIQEYQGTSWFEFVSDDYSKSSVWMEVHRNTGTFTVKEVTFPNGNVGIGTTSPGYPLTMGGGAYCTGSQWQNACDRNLKENFQTADAREILEKVTALPVATWNYKSEKSSVKHLGPTAQDFKAAFNLGDNDKSIGTVDEGGVALAAIQGLNQKVESENAELRAQNAFLKARLEKLEKLMSARNGGGQ
jgi:hypothetical protein